MLISMPDIIYALPIKPDVTFTGSYRGHDNHPLSVEYVRMDIYERRVQDLLESSNKLLERARKAEAKL